MLQKHLYQLLLMACGSLFFTYGCEKPDVDLPDQPAEGFNRIYMPQAVNSPTLQILKISDSLQTLTYGANFGGQDYPSEDIPVTFTVDNSKVDSFNMAHGTSYQVLPGNSYLLSATSAVIPTGQVSTEPLSISFKTKGTGSMQAMQNYLLPITMSSNKSGVQINNRLQTSFFIVKAQPDLKDYPNYDRSTFQVVNFSSQEANGEGPNNGRAIFMLDGNTGTFWHTQWQGGSPSPPHHVTIDMGSAKELHGLSFVGRQDDGSGKPNEVNVELSLNNITWTDAGTFNLENNKNLQPQFLSKGFQQARYFRITIRSAYNANYTVVSELNAF